MPSITTLRSSLEHKTARKRRDSRPDLPTKWGRLPAKALCYCTDRSQPTRTKNNQFFLFNTDVADGMIVIPCSEVVTYSPVLIRKKTMVPTATIGPYVLQNPLIVAPMAGVTDRPFRQLCRKMGAGLAVSEMVIADSSLWHTRKSKLRLDHTGEPEPRSVQIAGGDADMLAHAAQFNAANGAQIIDINMGCPAKKVCNKAAGSALMKDEALVGKILKAVVAAVDVPVTLKMRTGWDRDNRNALRIARMAEDAGIQALAIHGRTRADAYRGEAEYDTIAEVKSRLTIPVFANGDITTPESALQVLKHTGADGLLIGRAAQGRPWIFREILHFLETGERLESPPLAEVEQILIGHLAELHDFYGELMGGRIARKHVGWYLQSHDKDKQFRKRFNTIDSPLEQKTMIQEYFAGLRNEEVFAA
jgi:tRNA-dihydrouridine synthase B